MKFIADMGISTQSVLYLRELKHDAVHAVECNLQLAADEEILAYAYQESRTVLTHDLDFGALMAASGGTLPSVIIFRLPDMRPHSVNEHLKLILEQYSTVLENGAILSVMEGRIRVRKLPI